MEIIITIFGLPLLYLGYKIGLGKMLHRDKWYKSFFFWYIRFASIAGITMNFQTHNYFMALPFFLLVGLMWANILEMIYKKIMNIKDGVSDPFKAKTSDELNEERIQSLQAEIKNTKSDIATNNKIQALEEELERLKNPQPDSEIIQEIKPESIPEPVKVDPVVEKNKTELKSIMNKLGF